MSHPQKGVFDSSDSNAVVIDPEKRTQMIILDWISGADVWCAFGEGAVFQEGFRLGATRPALVLDVASYAMDKGLNVISDTGLIGKVAWHKFRS